ncbi:hypothetical protein [Dechloromonas agitata]|uniref:hypothetical protein n=1 Tax=Dechloromonas agitata TaxID=73030 RepID=UPI00048693D4|nr:hypothetical protein [Dechloromonas agitata]
MQIRQRGNTITLIRNQYDKTIGRGRSITLGCLSTTDRHASPDLLGKLNEEELKQLEELLTQQRRVLDGEARNRAAKWLATYIRLATEFYLASPPKTPELSSMAREARDQWSKLLAAMVTAGVGRTRKRRSKTLS